MIKQTKSILCNVTAVIMVGLLTACDLMGPSEGEFVQACLEEGKRNANKRFSDEMGVNREAACKCAASEAKSSVSPDGYRAMILNMQGKKQEASMITSKMSEGEQMAVLKAGLEMFGKCVMGQR